jgi:alkanesulfonate monooxygenase SsuD/methylene tetrahydromethanopterin reductase-like flavin-dependent oxidoreductase (luciferase family)
VFDDLWRMADELGVDDNPFRANVGQYVLIADTDAEAERLYTEHVSHGTPRGMGHTPMHRLAQPAISFGELVDSGAIVAGSAATVRDRLADRARSYRVGNMLLSLQMGSMSTGLVNHSIDMFASGVMPHLRGIWSEYEDSNRWWPARLGGRPAAAVQPQPVAARLTWRRHSVC